MYAMGAVWVVDVAMVVVNVLLCVLLGGKRPLEDGFWRHGVSRSNAG